MFHVKHKKGGEPMRNIDLIKQLDVRQTADLLSIVINCTKCPCIEQCHVDSDNRDCTELLISFLIKPVDLSKITLRKE